tara:strand:+ start:2537 stop:2716 length:180 start_codon:yes stop_codon:yes gene_type:complete
MTDIVDRLNDRVSWIDIVRSDMKEAAKTIDDLRWDVQRLGRVVRKLEERLTRKEWGLKT